MVLTTRPSDELADQIPPPDADDVPVRRFGRFSLGGGVMAATIVVLGAYVLVPIGILLVISFNTAPSIFVGPAKWGFGNWIHAWSGNDVLPSLYHRSPSGFGWL